MGHVAMMKPITVMKLLSCIAFKASLMANSTQKMEHWVIVRNITPE
jgi:hypothetical protein